MTGVGEAIVDNESLDDLKDQLSEAQKVKRWVQEIKFYETKAQQWHEKSKKIIRRYKDDRSPREQNIPRFNILWSNIETLRPALFGRNPKPDIERRYRDKDDIGRISSIVLERSINYFMNESLNQAMKQAVIDRLLPGRGTVWVRYEPHFKDKTEDENEEVADEGEEITDNVESYADNDEENEEPQEISDEVVCWDYVHWQDFGHTFGRTWEEIDAPWRKVYKTREELIERFGAEIGEKVTLDYSPHDIKDNKYDEVQKKATIYEIWCKSEKKVYWIHKDYHESPLDEQDDPLELEDFFPFPMPLYATLCNDTMIPVPDYIQYQDQAAELDELTSRIGAITKAVKVAGVYAKDAQGLERLLAEGVENQLIPIDQWAIFAEKGGIKGAMELLPMQDILQTLLGLYQARDKVKGDLYEITGISDIIRGASDPDETATAQRIKGQFGTIRLTDKQDDVKRFARDLVKIGTQIISNHFGIDTIKKICGIQLLTEQEKQVVQQRMQMLQQIQQMSSQTKQPPNPQLLAQLPPLPSDLQNADQEEMDELMQDPTWEDVEELLRNETMLCYKIDIETDSTIKFDQDAERDARVQFLDATGKFLSAAMANQNPDLAPLLAKLLMFGVRGFTVGKELESAFEVAVKKLEKDAQDPSKRPPHPEMAKIQGQQQIEQARLQSDAKLQQAKLEAEQQLEVQRQQADQAKMALEDKRIQLQAQLDNQQEAAEIQSKLSMAKLEAETKIAVAQIQAKTQLQTTQMNNSTPETGQVGVDENGNQTKQPSMADLLTTVISQLQTALQSNADTIAQSHKQLAQALAKPKQVMRDDNGNIVGVQ